MFKRNPPSTAVMLHIAIVIGLCSLIVYVLYISGMMFITLSISAFAIIAPIRAPLLAESRAQHRKNRVLQTTDSYKLFLVLSYVGGAHTRNTLLSEADSYAIRCAARLRR